MDWVVAVDDDVKNLEMAGHILSKHDMRVTGLKSGAALIEHLKTNKPDLILLDVNMPGLDGFETLEIVRRETDPADRVPVIFLTADDSQESETRGLQLGAMDYIRKPFVPHVLALRVRHTIDLVRLQKDLAAEVERKTREIARKSRFWTTFFSRHIEEVERRTRENAGLLLLHVVQALAEAIDEKDAYTGHSDRVAVYAREIGKRLGYTREEQDTIYMMGLLHDVGKIGLPEAVLNKRGRLTDEEADLIRSHPVMGARILNKISEMPKLAVGALRHHERYDGAGYPDGLAGEDIPEEARIIAVANACDAMIDREALPPEAVRSALEQGKGTLFDPVFADIMLLMLSEGLDTMFNLVNQELVQQLMAEEKPPREQ